MNHLTMGPSINDVGNWSGREVKNLSKLPTDSTKKLPTWGKGGVKNPENRRRHLWMVPKEKMNYIEAQEKALKKMHIEHNLRKEELMNTLRDFQVQ